MLIRVIMIRMIVVITQSNIKVITKSKVECEFDVDEFGDGGGVDSGCQGDSLDHRLLLRVLLA